MDSSRPMFAPLLVMIIATVLSLLLFMVALIEWLAEIFGSLVLPCLLVGCFSALIAAVVYILSLRPMLAQVRERFETTYEVFRRIRRAADWVQSLLGL